MQRCDWSKNVSDDYMKYHDEEWGVPVHDDRIHFGASKVHQDLKTERPHAVSDSVLHLWFRQKGPIRLASR